jgi:DNA helicase II / ATP-dependent DNA helicase PcrA
MSDFLENLNPAQREAASHKNGPLLIIAGAGTGKTRVLTHRICHLIQGGIDPDEILALTFTEKAALEMQERLDTLLPYGYVELWAKTFHGFSDAVLRERGLEIGLDTSYQILSQTDTALLLKKHLFELELNYYRPLGNPLRFISALVTHFGHLRDELISPETYLEYASSLDDEEGEKQLELAKAYQKYDEILMKEGVLDFASLQYLVVKLFETRPAVLTEYQERFKHIMVDEYQDTNTAQSRIVELLADRYRNLMVVGDDDQCIYKWRGASLSNILQFEETYKDAKKIVLKENYRSTQPILDLSYKVIQNNNPFRLESRENLDKNLIAKANLEPRLPRSVHFNHYAEEVKFVTEQVENYAQKEGCSYKDIAILVRATAHAAPYLDSFQKAGIPFYFSGAQGLYQRPEIKDFFAVLRLLLNPYDDVALFRVLSMPIFEFETEFLVSELHRSKTASTPLLKTLRNKETNDLSLKKFFDIFGELQQMVKTSSTSQILGVFIKKSSYLNLFEDQNESEEIQNIATFSQIVRGFEQTHGSTRLLECLDYLNSRAEMGDRVTPSEEALDSDTVKVLTVHAAKGLEFDTVFLVNLVQHRFPSIGRRDPLDFPEQLLRSQADKDATHLHEERRLFYVAATRAKKRLFLTHSDYYEGKKRWKPSVFVGEAEGLFEASEGEIEIVAATDSPEDKTLVFEYQRAHRPLRLSFSRINTFQTCPLRYKFQYVYRLAEPLSHQLSFGQSVHNTLNTFYQEIKQGRQPSLERLNELLEKHWIPIGYTSPAHHEARKKRGQEILGNFFKTNSEAWVIPEYLERPFTLKVPSGLSVSGRIDRIDRLSDGTLEIIDYKTGKLKDQKHADKDLQLSIYALACKQVFKLPVSKLSLYYLEDNKKITTTRSSEQLTATQQELQVIAETMTTSDFAPKPSPFICKYCDYRLVCNKAAA